MDPAYRAASDIYVLPTSLPMPGSGTYVVNAYLILSDQPVLVDTGLAVDAEEFIESVPADEPFVPPGQEDFDAIVAVLGPAA
jgi:hypothetical protein